MDKKLLILGIIFMVAFIAFSGYVVFQQPIARLTRAANPQAAVSPQTSLIFAWPLSVKADNKTNSEISVFVRDSQGRGLAEKRVQIQATVGKLTQQSAITDSDGKAIFKITSDVPGVAEITATVDTTRLQRTVSVKFE